MSNMSQIIQTSAFRHGNDFRPTLPRKSIARGYVGAGSSSRAQSFEPPRRLLKLEDNENSAINLCRSLYDKDRETKYMSPIRVLFGGYSIKRKTSLS